MQLRLYLAAGMLFLGLSSMRSQDQPVSWTYTVKPIGLLLFEVHLRATIQDGWHIYAQHQPQEAISVPTAIHYTSNPLITLQGPTREDGKLIHYCVENLDIVQDEYQQHVDFVQRLQLKAAVKTRISGTIKFQVCTDQNCLPPANQDFSIELSPPAVSK